jgi:hypothetical protein
VRVEYEPMRLAGPTAVEQLPGCRLLHLVDHRQWGCQKSGLGAVSVANQWHVVRLGQARFPQPLEHSGWRCC